MSQDMEKLSMSLDGSINFLRRTLPYSMCFTGLWSV